MYIFAISIVASTDGTSRTVSVDAKSQVSTCSSPNSPLWRLVNTISVLFIYLLFNISFFTLFTSLNIFFSQFDLYDACSLCLIPSTMVSKHCFSSFSITNIDFDFFASISSMDVSTLARFEPESYDRLVKMHGDGRPLPNKVYFNKGL